MICSEVVNLPPEHLCPEVFTDELHYIQLILKAGWVSGQPRQSKCHLSIMYHLWGYMSHCTCCIVIQRQYVSAYVPLNESLSHPESHAFENRNTSSSVLKRGYSSGLFSYWARTNFMCVIMCTVRCLCGLYNKVSYWSLRLRHMVSDYHLVYL